MIEIVIERWANSEGGIAFHWPIWGEGHPLEMAVNRPARADAGAGEAVEFCWRELGRKPDKVTRL